MAKNFAYMTSTKNLAQILSKIKGAGTPPRFTHEFLKSNLGFPSSNDRTVIGVLKSLGFLAPDSSPTDRYNEFRDGTRSGAVLATGMREGWADIFLSDQRAYERSSAQLIELFKGVAGVGDAVAQKMATTFKVLASQADWKAPVEVGAKATPSKATEALAETATVTPAAPADRSGLVLHHDIHLHLPPTSDVAVYTAIFRALRSELLD